MNPPNNQPTRSTANAHNEQAAADTNRRDASSRTDNSPDVPEFRCHREEEVLKGNQIWISSELTQKAAISSPVFLSTMIYKDLLAVCPNKQEWDALWDMILANLGAALNESPHRKWVPFSFSASYSAEGRKLKNPVRLMASRGPFDVSEPRQAITLWYPYPDYDPFQYLEDKK